MTSGVKRTSTSIGGRVEKYMEALEHCAHYAVQLSGAMHSTAPSYMI